MSERGSKHDRVADLEAQLDTLRARLLLQESRLAAMREIGRSLSRTLDLDEVLVTIMNQVTRLMDADRSTLFVFDPDTNELWSRVLQDTDLQEIRQPLGQGISGWVAKFGKTVNLVDAYEDDRFDQTVDRQTGYRTRSMLCMPIHDPTQRVLGVIQVLNKRTGRFSVEDEALLEALASQAAISLENAKLYLDAVHKNIELGEARADLERRLRELDLLYELEQEVSRSAELDVLLDRILAKAMEAVQCEAGSILLKEGESGQLFFKAALGEKGEEIKRYHLPAGQGVAGYVAEHGEARIANDLAQEPHFDADIAQEIEYPTRNLLCVPLGEREAPIGALELINKKHERDFDEDDLRLLTVIAGQATRTIDLERHARERRDADRLSAIGRMLAGVMHDLKTPMTVISGYSDLLIRADSTAEREQYGGTIVRQVEVMNHMIRELLAFARGETEVLRHRVHLDRFFREMERMLKPEFDERGIALAITLDYEGTARLDEEKLRRLVQNIARNAYDAMPDGGRLDISLQLDGSTDEVVLTFTDTGGGIPVAIRDSVFESFATHGKRGGTGLGLAIAKKFVEDHGGTIGFETASGAGTTFTVRLPRKETRR